VGGAAHSVHLLIRTEKIDSNENLSVIVQAPVGNKIGSNMLSSIGSSIGSSIDLSSIGFDVVAGAATAEDPRLEIAQWGQSDVGVALADCAADAYLTAGRPACSVRQQEGAGRLPGAGVAFLVQIHHLICNGGRSLTSLAR